MANLSITTAWNEAMEFFRREAGLILPVAFLLGGMLNAGFTLQGADFPSGLVGVMQGLVLFCALGGEVLVRYRIRFGRSATPAAVAPS